MKKHLLLILCSFLLVRFCEAQILCVQCYQQNDSVWAGTNNLIVNGGFENTTCIPSNTNTTFCPNATFYNCNISNWVCTGGGPLTYVKVIDNGFSLIPQGIVSVYFGNEMALTCSTTINDTSCLSDSLCMVSGVPAGYPTSAYSGYGGDTGVSLQQTVTGLITGNTYILEFWAGGESDAGTFTKRGVFGLDIGFGRILLRDSPTLPTYLEIGTRYVVVFNATSSSHTIKFTNWGHIFGVTCTELILDDVKLYHWNSITDPPLPCPVTEGINEPKEKEVTISPNPATNQLTVTTNNNATSTIIIYDMLSRKLMEETFTNTTTLNIESLSKGIYVYEVRSNKETVKGKVIKE